MIVIRSAKWRCSWRRLHDVVCSVNYTDFTCSISYTNADKENLRSFVRDRTVSC